MSPLDRLWIWRTRAACEMALLCRGGDELLQDARTEAAWYADLHHPWDHVGCEPACRINAYLSILVARLYAAARSCGGRSPETEAGVPLDGCTRHD